MTRATTTEETISQLVTYAETMGFEDLCRLLDSNAWGADHQFELSVGGTRAPMAQLLTLDHSLQGLVRVMPARCNLKVRAFCCRSGVGVELFRRDRHGAILAQEGYIGSYGIESPLIVAFVQLPVGWRCEKGAVTRNLRVVTESEVAQSDVSTH